MVGCYYYPLMSAPLASYLILVQPKSVANLSQPLQIIHYPSFIIQQE